jgi:aminopeptidase-like protein
MVGGESDERVNELAMLWVLNMSDGNFSLLDIADRSSLDFRIIKNAAAVLLEHDLLKEFGS